MEGEDSDDVPRTVRGTRRSATTKTRDKTHTRESREHRERREERPRTRKVHSDNGYEKISIPQDEKLSSPVKTVEVIPERYARDRGERDRDERRKPSGGKMSATSPRKSSRPPNNRTVTFPTDNPKHIKNKDEAVYYGHSSEGTPVVIQSNKSIPRPPSSSGHRPRPSSFIGSRPPLSTSATYQAPPYATPYIIPGMNQAYGQFPQQYSQQFPPPQFYNEPQQPPPPSPMNIALRDRFNRGLDPIQRTASAASYRHNDFQITPRGYIDDSYYESATEERDFERSMAARAALIKQKELDAMASMMMPPPPLPPAGRRNSILQPIDIPIRSHRPIMADDDRSARGAYRDDTRARRRRSSIGPSITASSYEHERPRIKVESASGRRNSYYSGSDPQSTYEDKLSSAAGYQEEVSGTPVQLTADMLRKQQRAVGSSTRSSESRDESDFKHSATTRTTRSGSGQEGDDVTIRIMGKATVNVAGAKIEGDDGFELNIFRKKSTRGGSEASASEFGAPAIDDRRRPPAIDDRRRPAIDDRRSRDGRRAANHSRSGSIAYKGNNNNNNWF
jgi:hypothetical protein